MSPSAAWEVIRADLLRHRRRPDTIRMHRYVWFDWCGFLGPRRRLERVCDRDLDRYLARPARGSRGNGSALAAASQHTYASVLVGCYDRLVDAGRLRASPLARYVLPSVGEGPPRDLAAATVAALLDLAARDERDLLVVLLAWGAGLRIGSIAQARVEDVDLREPPSLYVRGKAGRNGVVPLAPLVAAFLRGYLAGRPRSGPLVCNRATGRAGRHVAASTAGTVLRRLLREVGSPATPHQLRHTFATSLLTAREGEGLRAVSRLMLHSSVRSTERYTRGYDGDALATIRLLRDPRG